MEICKKNNSKKDVCLTTIFLLLFLLSIPFQSSSLSQTMALPDNDLIVVKLYIDNKPQGYITASWDEEQACSFRLFEILDALEFKYEGEWEKQKFICYVTPDKWVKISKDTLSLWDGKTLSQSKEARWSPSNDLYVTSNFLKEFYQIKSDFILNELAFFITTNHSEPCLQNREKIRRIKLIKRQKEDNILSDIDTLPRSNLKINNFSYSLSQNKNFGMFHNYNYDVQAKLIGEMLTGTFNLRYDYGSNNRSNKINDNLRFNWEKLDVKSKIVKSILVNHDYPSLITSTYGYASSITLSNTSKQANLDLVHNYTGKTFPNSEVEIYSNDQIIDYVKSDSLGNFKVTISNTDSKSNLKAVTLNSLGIPVAEEALTLIPYGTIKSKQLIYKFTTGITDYGDLFFAPTLEYGLCSKITLLAGNETVINTGNNLYYRKKGTTSAAILGVTLSDRNFGILDIKYLPSQLLRTRYNVSHYGIRANINYEYRNTNQTISNSLMKQMLQLNIGGNLPSFINGNYSLGLNSYNYQQHLGYMQSSYLSINIWKRRLAGNFSINTISDAFNFKNPVFSTRLGYYFKNNWYNETILEYSTGIKNRLRLGNRTNVQFANKLTAFLDVSYQFKGTQKYINIGVNWRLPFIQLNAGSYTSSHNTNIYTQASGSMLFQNGKVGFSYMLSTSAALQVFLFVDVNGNGVRDEKEPLVKNPKMKLNIACIKTEIDKGVLFTDIQPHKAFRLSIPQQRLGDISWQIDDYHTNLMLYPNQCRTLFIPVKVLTEISGQINRINNKNTQGVKDIDLLITNTKTGKQTRLTTDEWGNYIFMGLTCGSYMIDLVPDTLQKLKLKKEDPDKLYKIEILPALEGEQLEGLDFNLIPISENI